MTFALFLTFGLAILVVVLIVLTGVGLLVVLRGTGPGNSVTGRLQTYAYVPEKLKAGRVEYRADRLLQLRLRANRFLSIFVSRQLNDQLTSANWPITTSEFAVIRLFGSGLVFLLGWLLSGSILPGIGLFLIAYISPGIWLRRSILQRRRRFERQLVDVLVLMTGAVRAGYSLLQALSVVRDEIGPPASEEFTRVTREVELGRSLSDALNAMSQRMENDDLQLVVTSININQQVGGNMATMLEAVTDTIRERQRLFGEIRAQTSQQRFTGLFLTLLPVIVAGVLLVINPQYMSTLFDIACIPIGALVGVIIGNIFVNRMVDIKV
ncbi:MAG TPA: type II secretion system F family protein [Anaerolineales bacterium]|nr:type II secretion system F family protein [Anaerolineales bacterium]